MTTLQQKTYTADDFWDYIAQPDNADKFYELVDGEIVELTPSSAVPTIVALRAGRFIVDHVDEHNIAGYVAGADGGFKLSEKDVYSPDVAYISKERQPKLPDRFFPGAPDLAVEVVSPTDKETSVRRKALRYIKFGVRLVWVIYPDEKVALVYRPSESGDAVVQEIGIDGILDGGDVLPGFKLPLRDLYKVVEE
jgi:Uma2 family endonuclease